MHQKLIEKNLMHVSLHNKWKPGNDFSSDVTWHRHVIHALLGETVTVVYAKSV